MVDISGRKLIGQRAQDWEDSLGETYIRGFKEGETKLRPLQVTADWRRYKEHYYGKEIGYGPCSEEPDCVGCNDVSEKVRNVSTRYAFNALNEKGQIVVYKIGSSIKKKLTSREQRISPTYLLDRDLKLIRTGKGFNDTEYDFEFGAEYPIENPPTVDELHDLGVVITERYVIVEQELRNGEHIEDDPDRNADEDGVHDAGANDAGEVTAAAEPEPEKPAAKKAAAKKTAGRQLAREPSTADSGRIGRAKPAQKTAEPEPEPAADAGADEAQADAGAPAANGKAELSVDELNKLTANFASMETEDIRTMLDGHEVEYPQRAPRPKLIAIATDAVVAGKLPPF